MKIIKMLTLTTLMLSSAASYALVPSTSCPPASAFHHAGAGAPWTIDTGYSAFAVDFDNLINNPETSLPSNSPSEVTVTLFSKKVGAVADCMYTPLGMAQDQPIATLDVFAVNMQELQKNFTKIGPHTYSCHFLDGHPEKCTWR